MTARIVCFALALLLAPALAAHATTVTLNVDGLIEGDEPTSLAPWLILKFEDITTDLVRLTVTSNLEDSDEFFGGAKTFGVAFNVNPSIVPSSVGITEVERTGSFLSSPVISKSVQNGQDFTPLGNAPTTGFDFRIGLSQGKAKFGSVEQVVFELTAVGLDALDFNYTNPRDLGGYYAAAHLQGIDGGGSAKVAATVSRVESDVSSVPDGGMTMTLLGCALVGLAGLRQRFGA